MPVRDEARLAETIARLERRVQALERVIDVGADGCSLYFGNASVGIGPGGISLSAKNIRVIAEDSVSLFGKKLLAESQNTIDMKAGGDFVMKGARIKQN